MHHQGCKFNKNQRIDSRHDSRNIQVWESISLIEWCTKCLGVYYIWFSQAATNLHPWIHIKTMLFLCLRSKHGLHPWIHIKTMLFLCLRCKHGFVSPMFTWVCNKLNRNGADMEKKQILCEMRIGKVASILNVLILSSYFHFLWNTVKLLLKRCLLFMK